MHHRIEKLALFLREESALAGQALQARRIAATFFRASIGLSPFIASASLEPAVAGTPVLPGGKAFPCGQTTATRALTALGYATLPRAALFASSIRR